ncbi:hypothetical protein, partial [Roseibium sp.]|uniref:hypothetical protein n=1 Tax=Roseibium sp. TaxID=1936156 RepID=UPI003513E6DF
DMTRPHQKALCPTHWHKKSLILLPQPNKKKAALLGGLFCWITRGRDLDITGPHQEALCPTLWH